MSKEIKLNEIKGLRDEAEQSYKLAKSQYYEYKGDFEYWDNQYKLLLKKKREKQNDNKI